MADIVTREVGGVFHEDPPRSLARTPGGCFNLDLIHADVKRSGFSDILIEVSQKMRGPSC
jgi:hypothetical protein